MATTKADGKKLSIRIITPERIAFDGEADSVVATAYDGQMGILPGHAPLMVVLGIGELRVQDRREAPGAGDPLGPHDPVIPRVLGVDPDGLLDEPAGIRIDPRRPERRAAQEGAARARDADLQGRRGPHHEPPRDLLAVVVVAHQGL